MADALVRLFIAVAVPADALAACQAVLDPVRTGPLGASARWVRTENLHLTVRFLGDTEPELIPDLALAVMDAAAVVMPFGLELAGAGAFPDGRHPRTLWLGVAHGNEGLEALEDASEVLVRAGSRREAMRALDLLGALLDTMARREAAILCLDQSLAIALETRDSRGEMLARLHLGATLTRSGRPAAGRPHALRSVELARLTGDRYVESVAEWMLAELEDAMGDLTAAAACRRRELALLASIGGNAHNEALAHAHLALVARRTGDDVAAAREADLARAFAGRSDDPSYPVRIEKALAVASWAQTES